MTKSLFRRFTAGLSASFMLISAVPFAAAAENTPDSEEVTSFSDGILTYNVIEDTRFVEISQCASTAVNVNILPKIDGYTVTAIGEGAFAGCDNLQSVTFPKNAELTSIGSYAFAECHSLKSVKLPDTVEEIPAGMFAFCHSLESVTFGKNTKVIGNEAFRECSALSEITLPDTLTDIGDFVFYMCTSLQNISIPESLSCLGGYTFMGCVNLTDFSIPDTLIDFGDGTFSGCLSLKNITVDPDNPTYTVKDGVIYSKDETELYFYPPSDTADSFTVPEGVKTIHDCAFFKCENLKEVIFPDTLEVIGAGAFDYCTSLSYAKIPESVTTIYSTAFADCSSLASVTFEGADNETEGEGVPLTIGDHAFIACTNLKEVVLPKRTESIGEYAFGVTDSDSEETDKIAVEGFLLKGFDAAEQYAKDCDISINFSHRSFPWKKVVFWVCGAAAVIVILFFAARIVKKNMMTPEEKEALRQAKLERNSVKEEEEAEQYESIVGDDEDTDNDTDTESKETAQKDSFRSSSPSRLHNIGHHE